MSDPDNAGVTDGAKSLEIRLKGRPVSRGVAIGTIVCLHGSNRQFFRIELQDSAIEPEVKRLQAAIIQAKLQLAELVFRKSDSMAPSGPSIFESHLLLTEDPELQSKIENEIRGQKINAEWAIKVVADSYVSIYKALKDEFLRDRYVDIEDVSERILAALGGVPRTKIRLSKGSIIAARELKPSTLVDLSDERPLALITENGGWTSHTFILAREMSCPGVTGLKKIFHCLKTGDRVIVDAYNGQIIVNPDENTLQRYKLAAATFAVSESNSEQRSALPVKTLDGKDIRVYANSDTANAYQSAKRLGAQGVGLCRSEFLFNRLRRFPTEDEQCEAYRSLAKATGEYGVKIRTFDLGAEQLLDQTAPKEKNPALGLRAIRIGLAHKKQLKSQLRAVLRASHESIVDIVIPMVSGMSEILAVKQLLIQERRQLIDEGIETGNPRLGVMIEVPSAILMINEIVEETDFTCLGTNDLIQYLLAADRDNEAVSIWYRTLHPAVLRSIRAVVNAGIMAGKSVIACGEMAGSPYYVPILIGLGVTEFSMNVRSIPRVRAIVAGVAVEEAVAVTQSIEHCRTVEETEKLVALHIQRNWSHLFPADFTFISEAG